MNIKDQLQHAVTTFDIAQSKRKGYNPYALGAYLECVDQIVHNVERGDNLRTAIIVAFNDRLRDHVLRSLKLATT